MVHSKNKILLLVEGNKTEPNLMKRYAKLLENEFKLEIISFETNIYVLYQNIRLLNENFDMDSTSTIEVLKSILKERMLKLINNQNLEKLETIKQQIKLLDDNYPRSILRSLPFFICCLILNFKIITMVLKKKRKYL